VLRSLTRLLQTRLLPLDDASVAGEEAGLLQRRTVVLGIGGVERTSDPQAHGTGLTAGAATGDQSDDVVAVGELELDERRADQLLVHLVREVHVQRPPVDAPLAGARNDPHAGDGPLATARRGSRLDGREARRGGVGGVALDGDLVG